MRAVFSFLNKEEGFLTRLLLLAGLVRTLAAIFSEGYHMSDDHFLAIEPVGSWVMGENYHNWYPNAYNQVEHAQPFSYFYYFLNYLFLSFAKWLVGGNPFTQMLVVRFIHAGIGMWGVYEFYKLVRKLNWNEMGKTLVWTWAFAGIVTVYEVHQMPEMVCIPFLLAGANFWLNDKISSVPLAGMCFAFAVGMRYQVVWIPLTLGLYALFSGQWKRGVAFGISFVLFFFLTQIDDVLLWQQPPFQHLIDYYTYNSTHFGQYPSNILSYLSLVTYYVLLPISVLIGWNLFQSKAWKDFGNFKALFLAVGIFIVFHLLVPNRQERFLLPAVPFLLLLAAQYIPTSKIKWVQVNWILSLVFTLGSLFYMPKRNQLEACRVLQETGKMRNVIVDNYAGDGPIWLPLFYTGRMVHPYAMHGGRSIVELKKQILTEPEYNASRLPMPRPNYLILWGRESRDTRKESYQSQDFKLKSIRNELDFEIFEIDFPE